MVFLPARPHKVNKSEHALGTTLLLINPVRVPGRAAGALAAACVPTTQCRTVLTVTDDTPAARGLVVSRRSSLYYPSVAPLGRLCRLLQQFSARVRPLLSCRPASHGNNCFFCRFGVERKEFPWPKASTLGVSLPKSSSPHNA